MSKWYELRRQKSKQAVEALRAGDLVVFPTETVYGLGANASNPAAVRKIFEVKGRPPDHPVIVHLDDPRYLHRWVSQVPPVAAAVGRHFLARTLDPDFAEGRERQ